MVRRGRVPQRVGHQLASHQARDEVVHAPLTVQIVLSSGEHGGNGSSFVIATMADMSQVAYVETAIRGLTTDDAADLAAASRVLADLRNRALPGNMSRDLMRKVAEERWT
ncbi:Scr1 family TA system antitoxin-like transcriptional regulator [Actinomadura chokoriensis]|uniref:Scr1 family TA system antitoxin-like transcriptional regulator n=1 Tax=Actinomadura chokoriensis TaxID=454156 RepID=UPI0035666C8E